MLRNLILLLVFLVIVASSSIYWSAEKTKILSINTEHFYKNLPAASNQGILICCMRCNCVDQSVSSFIKNDLKNFPGLLIAGDTNCIRFPDIYHFSDLNMEILSEDLYSIVIFRKKENKVECRIIETKEHRKLGSICKRFFK